MSVTRQVLEGRGALRYLSGTDEARILELEEAFSGDYDLVWMARGGSGLARLMPGLRLDRLAPVPFFGFSDGTTLLNVLAGMGRVAVHAPVVQMLSDAISDSSREALADFLHGKPRPLVGEMWQDGVASGKLVGGNLCVLASLCGTPFQRRAQDRVVLLEDIQEPPYKLDRMLTQLLQSGFFEGCRGIVLGEFLGCAAPAGAGWGVEDVLKELLLPLGVPILARVPVGHGSESWPVCMGSVRLGEGCLWPELGGAIVQAALERSI